MKYYNIHTHAVAEHPEDISIVNTIIGQPPITFGGFRSAGIHPLYIDDPTSQLNTLAQTVLLPDVVAIGECGIDKRGQTGTALQQEIFISQLQMASNVHKPVIIHCVKAWGELLEAEKEAPSDLVRIIHGFRGNGILAEQLLRHGHALSFGPFFHPDAVRAAWPEHIFAETDESAIDIRQVYNMLAETLSLPLTHIVQQLAVNMQTAFYQGI